MGDGTEILDTIVREFDAGRAVALCAIVATRGSTPQPAGTMVCVDEAAHMTGTLGGGCVEADVRRRAHALLCASTRELKSAAGTVEWSEMVTLSLDNDFGYDDGMICGGQMDLAVCVLSHSDDVAPYRRAAEQLRAGEAATLPARVQTTHELVEYRIRIEAEPKLVIAGAGHISRTLAGMMLKLGFRVSVVDDRTTYANRKRFPPPIEPVVGDIAETLARWPLDCNTYVVIVTRGHKHDERALQAVLHSEAKYLGMIGSRRKVDVVLNDLRHAGATEAQLARVHAPIGLGINAVTTEEIALCIAAELVSVRRADHQNVVEGPIRVSQDNA